MIRRKAFRERMCVSILVFAVSFTSFLPSTANPQGGNPMDLVLLNDAGEKVRLGQVAAGKPVLLYFWATWCRPCRKTRPKVSDFAKKYGNQVKVLGINLGGLDSLEGVRKYRSRYKITYPLLLDRDNELAEIYSVFAIPSVIFIDSSGEILYRAQDPPASPEKFLSK